MALKFNGTSDAFEITGLGSIPTATWCAFFNSNCTGNYQAVMNWGDPSTFADYHVILWMMDNANGTCDLMLSFDDENPSANRIGPLKNGNWYFIAVTYAADAATAARAVLYVKSLGSGGFSYESIVAVSGNKYIASLRMGTDSFDESGPSTLGGARMYDRVLAPSELIRESRSIRAASRVGLSGEWFFRDPTERTDSSGYSRTLTVPGGKTAPTEIDNPPVPWSSQRPWYEAENTFVASGTTSSDAIENAGITQLRTNAVYRLSPRSEREAQQYLRAKKRAHGFDNAAP